MKKYTANCVHSSADSIDDMCDCAEEIEYAEFIKQIDVEELKTLFPHYNWSDDKAEDLTLEDDWAVSFWESEFVKAPCVYIDHSGIEYIFC